VRRGKPIYEPDAALEEQADVVSVEQDDVVAAAADGAHDVLSEQEAPGRI
jgi:hypothetical protein